MTDAEGHFSFGELFIEDLELQASPPDRFASPGQNSLAVTAPGAIEFRIARFAWVQVEVERPKFIDSLEFLDAEGRPQEVDVHLQSTVQRSTRVEALPRRAGFPRVQVPENAVEVVLRRRDEITARAALELDFERETRLVLAPVE